MTYDAEYVTETRRLEERITRALVTIRDEAPMIVPRRPAPVTLSFVGRASLIKHADDDERDDDIDGLTRRVDALQEIHLLVNSWTRLVVEDANVTATIPDGFDLRQMCDFLIRWSRWVSGHEAAPDMADELESCVAGIRRFVPELKDRDAYLASQPPLRYGIGRCPVEREVEDDGALVQRVCGGKVYAYPDDDGEDERDFEERRVDPWAICSTCGHRAVVSYWQRLMFPEVAEEMRRVDRVLTMDEVITFAHKEYGRRVSKQAVWQWVSRDKLKAVDPTTKPHTYRLRDVIDTLTAMEAG